MTTPGGGQAFSLEMERIPWPPFPRSQPPSLNTQFSSEADMSTQSSRIGAEVGGERSFRPGWASASIDSMRRLFLRKEGTDSGRPDRWSSSKKVPRGVGVLAFMVANCAVILGFSLSFGCRACYGSRGSQVHIPDQFAVTDTLRESPTRWIGLVLFTCSTLLLVLLGWFRHKQIRHLSDTAFPALLRPNFFSAPFGILSCVSFIAMVTLPPSFDETLLIILRMASFSLGIAFTGMYVIIQCVWIEKHLINTEVIASSPHKLRKALLLIGGIMAFVAFSFFVIRKDVSTKADKSEDSAMAVGVLLLFSEAGSALLAMAALCLTDFGSLCINISKLERLQKTTYMASVSCKLNSASDV